MDEPAPPPWEQELPLVRQGDDAAARRLVEALYPKVIRIVRNHLPTSMDEQDLAQDIFVKIFTKLDQFRGSQPFDHWVARVALNTCYDRLRQHKARRVLNYADFSTEQAAYFDDLLSRQHHDESPAEKQAAASEIVEKMLSTLKPHEQLVLRLLDLEEKSVQEICALTGWGASRVKVTAFRARRKLADTFQSLDKATSL